MLYRMLKVTFPIVGFLFSSVAASLRLPLLSPVWEYVLTVPFCPACCRSACWAYIGTSSTVFCNCTYKLLFSAISASFVGAIKDSGRQSKESRLHCFFKFPLDFEQFYQKEMINILKQPNSKSITVRRFMIAIRLLFIIHY